MKTCTKCVSTMFFGLKLHGFEISYMIVKKNFFEPMRNLLIFSFVTTDLQLSITTPKSNNTRAHGIQNTLPTL